MTLPPFSVFPVTLLSTFPYRIQANRLLQTQPSLHSRICNRPKLPPKKLQILDVLTHRSSSVIRRKGESQSGVPRKQNMPNFPKNEHFLPPDTHTYVLCFLETPKIRPSALLPMFYLRNSKILIFYHGFLSRPFTNHKFFGSFHWQFFQLANI